MKDIYGREYHQWPTGFLDYSAGKQVAPKYLTREQAEARYGRYLYSRDWESEAFGYEFLKLVPTNFTKEQWDAEATRSNTAPGRPVERVEVAEAPGSRVEGVAVDERAADEAGGAQGDRESEIAHRLRMLEQRIEHLERRAWR
jgi:hypothetical protein